MGVASFLCWGTPFICTKHRNICKRVEPQALEWRPSAWHRSLSVKYGAPWHRNGTPPQEFVDTLHWIDACMHGCGAHPVGHYITYYLGGKLWEKKLGRPVKSSWTKVSFNIICCFTWFSFKVNWDFFSQPNALGNKVLKWSHALLL